MAKDEKEERFQGGYKPVPVNDGYQPDLIRGFQPSASLSQSEGANPPSSGSNIVPASQPVADIPSEE